MIRFKPIKEVLDPSPKKEKEPIAREASAPVKRGAKGGGKRLRKTGK